MQDKLSNVHYKISPQIYYTSSQPAGPSYNPSSPLSSLKMNHLSHNDVTTITGCIPVERHKHQLKTSSNQEIVKIHIKTKAAFNSKLQLAAITTATATSTCCYNSEVKEYKDWCETQELWNLDSLVLLILHFVSSGQNSHIKQGIIVGILTACSRFLPFFITCNIL